MSKNTSIVTMYAVTPCHAGSGSSMGVVDNPIQRERHTNWPVIQASGMKGALRANFDKHKKAISEDKQSEIKQFEDLAASIFGCDSFTEIKKDQNGEVKEEKKSGFAGSLSISDARILAYPMRSNIAPFVWITCPAVLKRLVRDLDFAEKPVTVTIPSVAENSAVCLSSDITGEVLLEDCAVNVIPDENKDKWFDTLKTYFKEAERLLLVPDDIFEYGVTDCTQILPQIKIKAETGTTEPGSLRYQEELPSDTIMYSVIVWGNSKNSLEDKLDADTIRKFVKDDVIKTHIQIAGDETLGRGIFELNWDEE